MAKKKRFQLPTLEATQQFGEQLGKLCESGDIICLAGALGAGKTTLTQSIARGAGVDSKEYVSSPSFAILHEYEGKLPFYHMDFYRLESSDDVLTLGLDEYFYLSGITVIEWHENAADIIPVEHLLIIMTADEQDRRTATISSPSPIWNQRIEELSETGN